jgi:hypothetical protein
MLPGGTDAAGNGADVRFGPDTPVMWRNGGCHLLVWQDYHDYYYDDDDDDLCRPVMAATLRDKYCSALFVQSGREAKKDGKSRSKFASFTQRVEDVYALWMHGGRPSSVMCTVFVWCCLASSSSLCLPTCRDESPSHGHTGIESCVCRWRPPRNQTESVDSTGL